MNFEQARFNMVEQQVRTWDVLDPRVLSLMGRIYREDFVPIEHRKLAYADTQIPIGHEQVMLFPREEGRILQALQVQSTDRVLEIGCGSGYFTTLLAHQAAHVDTVDIFVDFITAAKVRLDRLEIENVTFHVGDASSGWHPETRYDVICVTGSFYRIPDVYRQQLLIGGRLFAVQGLAPVMEAQLITRYGPHEWHTRKLYETVTPALINAPMPSLFEF